MSDGKTKISNTGRPLPPLPPKIQTNAPKPPPDRTNSSLHLIVGRRDSSHSSPLLRRESSTAFKIQDDRAPDDKPEPRLWSRIRTPSRQGEKPDSGTHIDVQDFRGKYKLIDVVDSEKASINFPAKEPSTDSSGEIELSLHCAVELHRVCRASLVESDSTSEYFDQRNDARRSIMRLPHLMEISKLDDAGRALTSRHEKQASIIRLAIENDTSTSTARQALLVFYWAANGAFEKDREELAIAVYAKELNKMSNAGRHSYLTALFNELNVFLSFRQKQVTRNTLAAILDDPDSMEIQLETFQYKIATELQDLDGIDTATEIFGIIRDSNNDNKPNRNRRALNILYCATGRANLFAKKSLPEAKCIDSLTELPLDRRLSYLKALHEALKDCLTEKQNKAIKGILGLVVQAYFNKAYGYGEARPDALRKLQKFIKKELGFSFFL